MTVLPTLVVVLAPGTPSPLPSCPCGPACCCTRSISALCLRLSSCTSNTTCRMATCRGVMAKSVGSAGAAGGGGPARRQHPAPPAPLPRRAVLCGLAVARARSPGQRCSAGRQQQRRQRPPAHLRVALVAVLLQHPHRRGHLVRQQHAATALCQLLVHRHEQQLQLLVLLLLLLMPLLMLRLLLLLLLLLLARALLPASRGAGRGRRRHGRRRLVPRHPAQPRVAPLHLRARRDGSG